MKTPPASSDARKRLARLPLLALAMLSLITGVWGGLVRLPLQLPVPADNANWITFHGPLMVCGFLGTLIGLERAVGLSLRWAYAAPLLTATGGLVVVAGGLGWPGPTLTTAGSAIFVLVTLRVVRLQRALFTSLMAAGAVSWLIGNVLWAQGWEVNRVTPWWVAFLALTILGERLDLARFQRPSPWARPLLFVALGLMVGGVTASPWFQPAGERLAGAGLVASALWLARFDIARRTVRQPGLPRFMAVCLLSGYAWLALAGALWWRAAPSAAGPAYDAALHAFFLGFVFSMIFGHAPVIFPAVLLRPVAFRPRFYLHLAVLHAALLLRLGGDLADWLPGRQWGGALNGVAIALFLANTVLSALTSAKPSGPGPKSFPSTTGTRRGSD